MPSSTDALLVLGLVTPLALDGGLTRGADKAPWPIMSTLIQRSWDIPGNVQTCMARVGMTIAGMMTARRQLGSENTRRTTEEYYWRYE